MGEKMTLKDVGDFHKRVLKSLKRVRGMDYEREQHQGMADAIEAHLTTPAQTVDVEAVEYVIDVLRLDAKTFSFTGLDNAHFVRLADKLTAALTEKGNG